MSAIDRLNARSMSLIESPQVVTPKSKITKPTGRLHDTALDKPHEVRIARRTLCLATAALAMSELPVAGAASPSSELIDVLFVQTATSMSFDRSTSRLTLQGVSPITLFFADRPQRMAGNMKTMAFVPFWSRGKDSFLADPPNADLSILERNQLQQIVVVLRDPVLHGDSLIYTVRVLRGTMPARAADVSVFIDVVGMPLTPVSYAGVARRSYRRAVVY